MQGPSDIVSGKTEDFKEWMFTLQEAIAILQPQDPVGYAASFMEESAQQWVMALWQDNGRISTWQQFQKQMCDTFAFEHQEKYERQRLVTTRQDGGLEDYIHTFSSRCLAARSMDDLTKTVLLTEGLVDGEVAREVQRFHHRTLSEAIRAARTAGQSKRSGDCATGNGELRQMIGQPVPKPCRDWKHSSQSRLRKKNPLQGRNHTMATQIRCHVHKIVCATTCYMSPQPLLVSPIAAYNGCSCQEHSNKQV